MHSGRLIIAILLVCVCGITARAEVSLNDSRLWRRARLLPFGQQVWGFQTSFQNYSDRFTGNGEIEPLGDRYKRGVTYKQLLDSFPEARAEIRRLMSQRRLSDNDIAASATYQVERREVGLAVDWAYGLTNRWMIGFQLPVVYRQTKAGTSVELTSALRAGAPGANGASILQNGEMRNKVAGMAKAELANSGYDAIPDQKNSWDWGDINLLSQVSLAESYRWTWALQQIVRVPTARNPDVSDYLQGSGDEGQVDVGLTSLLDWRHRKWVTGLRMGYLAQLPDTVRMRVSSARVQVDPSVRRDLGDVMWGSVDTDYRLTSRFNLNFEYAFLSKTKDHYESRTSNGTTYDSLGESTEQELHQTRVGFMYRLGSRSTRSGVENKWLASVGYTYPWIGRNSVDASRASLQVISYF